jgi:chlorite dismutase
VISAITTFTGGRVGRWLVVRNRTVSGEPLDAVERVEIVEEGMPVPEAVVWRLRGVTSSERYTNRREHDELAAISPPLGRPEASHAALIPITKSPAWWALPQDERRNIFEEASHHIATGLKHLPAIARRLHHGRDLGEPFDFLTWFEFAPAHSEAFEELVGTLRETDEWTYVVREVDLRLLRNPG